MTFFSRTSRSILGSQACHAISNARPGATALRSGPATRAEITALILTYNEAPNLPRTLSKLGWADQILIVDSFSTDETIAIAEAHSKTRVLQRRFDSFAAQCNFGLQHIGTPWVLSLDADYVLTDDLVNEILRLRFCPGISGYETSFRYCVCGHLLRSSLYPLRTVLFRRDSARYFDQGHSHQIALAGEVRRLDGQIEHDDRKPLARWFHDQLRYASAEAQYLAHTPAKALNWRDRLRRKIVLAPLLVCVYTLFGKGLILDGWPGCYYVLQRTLSETLLSLQLLDVQLRQVHEMRPRAAVAACERQQS